MKNHNVIFLLFATVVALGLAVPTAWSQNQNQFDADQQRATRNDQGREQYQSQDSDRPYNEQNYNDQNYQSGRGGQAEVREELRDDSQEGTFQDESRAERRQERREERSEEDGPAGLGVMLDVNQDEVEVREVARNSPADKAGIQRDDQIIAVNGQRIESPQQLTQLIREEEPGARVEIRIRRDGQQETLTAQLESLRQALDTMEQRGGEEGFERNRWSPEEEFYSNSPPWSDDELIQHVDQLERQVNAMRQQIEDLRSMLNDDPSQRRFSTSQRDRRDDSRIRD
jgi:C-terminal processing protease CtpA/Prc